MSAEPAELRQAQLQCGIDELREVIQDRYPAATFYVSRGQDDPGAVHLNVVVDVDDTDEVIDLVIDRLLELQIDEGLPIHVIPVRPLARVLAGLASKRAHETHRPGDSVSDP